MREKKGLIFGLIELVFLCFSIFYLGINIYNDYKNTQRDSDIHFQRFANQTVMNAEVAGFMTEDFVKEEIEFWNNNPGGIAFIITASQGTVMAYPADSKYLEKNPYGVPKLKTSSPLLFTQGKALNITGERNVTITTVYSSLNLGNSVTYIRNSFLLFLTVTILGLIFVIAGKLKNGDETAVDDTYSSYKKRVSDIINAEQKLRALDDLNYEEDLKKYDDYDNSGFEEPDNLYGEDWEAGEYNNNFDLYNTNFATDTSSDNNNDAADDFPLSPLEPLEQDTEGDISFPKEEPLDNENKEVHNVNAGQDNGALYSPVTGIVYETYLKDRLASELERASRDVQDVSLMLIRIKYLDRTDYVMHSIIETIKNAYIYKDMIFEFGTDGIAVVLPNTDIENALKSAENIYEAIRKILTKAGYTNLIGIGITVKSSRLVEKERFIEEAETACRKALQETTKPIVAFNPNPEKFRDFISEQ